MINDNYNLGRVSLLEQQAFFDFFTFLHSSLMLLGGSIHSFEASRLLLKSIVYEWDGNEAKYILLDGHTGSHDIDGLGTLVGQLQIKGNLRFSSSAELGSYSATRGQIFVSRHDDVLVVDVHYWDDQGRRSRSLYHQLAFHNEDGLWRCRLPQ